MKHSMTLALGAVMTLALGACSTIAPSTPTGIKLDGTSWKIMQVNDVRLTADQVRATTANFTEGRLDLSVGCNRMSGPYKMSGATISFGGLASTRMGCPPPLAGFESEIGALTETPVEASIGSDGILWLKGDRTRQLGLIRA